MGDERERDARDRHDADDHPDVHDELEEDHRREPGGHREPERVLGSPAGDEDPPDEDGEQEEDDDRADEPELLAELGEHEVRRLDREEVAAILRPVRQALPDEPAGADGDLRLEELVAGPLRIGLRVQEADEPLLLVVLEHVGPRDGHDSDRHGREHAEPAQARPGQEEHARKDRHEHE